MLELDLHVSQAPLYRDRTDVTSDFPLRTFQHGKLTIPIFIPTLFWPHPIVYPLTFTKALLTGGKGEVNNKYSCK
jgi:hypothetical protein